MFLCCNWGPFQHHCLINKDIYHLHFVDLNFSSLRSSPIYIFLFSRANNTSIVWRWFEMGLISCGIRQRKSNTGGSYAKVKYSGTKQSPSFEKCKTFCTLITSGKHKLKDNLWDHLWFSLLINFVTFVFVLT